MALAGQASNLLQPPGQAACGHDRLVPLHSCPGPAMQRIMKAQYSLPPDVALMPECRDLLARIFVADPSRRITLDHLRLHPWFLRNLPPELQVWVVWAHGSLGVCAGQVRCASG